MEDKENALFFSLLRASVSGEALPPQCFAALTPERLEKFRSLAQRHDLTHLLALGLRKQGLLPAGECWSAAAIYGAARRCEALERALTEVSQALSKEEICHIPLKGAVLRGRYPEPWMRTSCDVDILVHPEDLSRSATVLREKLGYRTGRCGSHDLTLLAPDGVHLELHYSLMEDYVLEKAACVLDRVWECAEPHKGELFRLELSDEMFYFYHLAHMAKHFVHGGCGIRPFLDLWVLRNCGEKALRRREALARKGGFAAFSSAAQALASCWFSGCEMGARERRMQEFILSGGSYGSMENRVAIQQQRQGGKLRYAWVRIWLSYDVLVFQYPALRGRRWLLPLYELRRWGRLLFAGRAARSARELRLNAKTGKKTRTMIENLLDELELPVKSLEKTALRACKGTEDMLKYM